jgi:hypothetical protein
MAYRTTRETQESDGRVVTGVRTEDEVVVQEHAVNADPAYVETVADQRTGTTTWSFDTLSGRVNTILFTILLALEGLLAMRFMLAAFSANPTSGFVDFIYDASYPFVRPFENAFANRTWDEGIVELSTLLAMGVWLLAFALVAMLLNAILPNVGTSETRTRRSRTAHL